MRNNSFFKIILIAITVVFFTSCDKDFNTIGGDLVNDNNFGLERSLHEVISYNQKIGPVQSNNLPVNALGVYSDPVFGTTEASFATQVVLATVNPTIGTNPIVESVTLNIPYFSHVDLDVPTKADGSSTYILDSIYGTANVNGEIKLSVYENGYYMRDLDPLTGFLEPQKFYTNQASDFESAKVPTRLNNDLIAVSQNDKFFFDPAPYKETTTVDEEETVTWTRPEMRLSLDKARFQEKIIDASASGKLASNDVFKNHFKGLYFKVEKLGSTPGRLAMMDFKSGTITIKYEEDGFERITKPDGSIELKPIRVDKSLVLNLTGNTVSLLSNTNASAYDVATTPANVNTVSGDDKLYLKGGEGAMAVLNLFGDTDVRGYDADGNRTEVSNNVPDQLDDLRNPEGKKKLLINEANLVFHVDETTMGSNTLPKRVYLYDLTNSTTVVDYLFDGTTGTNAKNGLLIYSGLLNTIKTEDETTYRTYKIRITNHIRSLINNKDSTNVKLGVVVTENINNSAMNKLRSSLTWPDGTVFNKVPQASVMSPLGVVFYGGTTNVPEDKKLKLEIYYTKPN